VVTCANCGAENPTGKRFCGDCGNPLAVTCPTCGAENPPGKKFCGDCGTPLTEVAAAGAPVVAHAAIEAPAPATERRLVSILFADLVGFTSLSESRDAEEVRELLSRYFDSCRRLVELYGGTVEKFIGDAVMAVWGTPTATEDDAERAVRAALDLVAAVSALGDEVGAVDLRARAAVLTGEAAVTVGATGQGMVAGDLVNTASRVQTLAEPGTLLVGEATRRATESAIVYQDAGTHELKGKEGQTRLWRALRVVSGVRGQLKSEGLEAPFVGRDRELRQIKDLFHVSADEGRAQLVSVTGIAGIGKSRLAWEFYKYIDGLPQTTYWHRGRCLAYGEGVTYWALADMVRMRCRIAEDDEPGIGLQKLHAALEEHLLDPEERKFVEPRLAQLLGLSEQSGRERGDLFAAWRLFFERLAETYPTVLAFEDMQWADASLLDFVEHLLEWSRNHPLFVITLARPELAERRPTWGAGHRNFTSLYLDPLSEDAMHDLLAGLVPGLPSSLREQILARAEGVPLYAVETVRMLLDRGLLVEEDAAYRVVGEVESLEVPETLHALVAARLDGLSPDERRLVQDAAVLGKTFAPAALGSLTGLDRPTLEQLLTGLVRREVLTLQSDPRSPEQGQYGFLQDLLRHVAYETLPKRERRAKHLAAAEFLSLALGEEEVAEVVASHLLDAYRLDPDSDDALPLKKQARTSLVRAGERAASLGASIEAQRYFEQAAELTDDPAEQATALDQAGRMAVAAGDNDRAAVLFERAITLYETIGDTHAAARASTLLGLTEQRMGRYEQAIDRMEKSYAVVADDEPDADVAFLLARLGAANYFAGNPERALEYTESALDIAEALHLPLVLCRGWTTKATIISGRRPEEARGLFQLALDTALEHDLHEQAASAGSNLSDSAFRSDRYADSLASLEQVVELARTIGDRQSEWFALSEMTYALTMLGRWDEAFARLAEIPDELIGRNTQLISPMTSVLEIHLNRGRLDLARELLAEYEEISSADVQTRGGYHSGLSAVRLAEGKPREALGFAEPVLVDHEVVGITAQDVKFAFMHAVEAALALGDTKKADELVSIVDQQPPGLGAPFLTALARRFRARLAGDETVAEREFKATVAQMAELEVPFHHAVVQLEYAEWLAARGRDDESAELLGEARERFERLEATPWLERVDAASASGRTEVPA
jgi:class 3 adenylate cyclase/tetratricopeptide (TPR) repeat protein